VHDCTTAGPAARPDDLGARRLAVTRSIEVAHHLNVDVGLGRRAHLAQALLDVVLGELAAERSFSKWR